MFNNRRQMYQIVERRGEGHRDDETQVGIVLFSQDADYIANWLNTQSREEAQSFVVRPVTVYTDSLQDLMALRKEFIDEAIFA